MMVKNRTIKKWLIGVDEVGRGPLAGPVYVCIAAILYKDYLKLKWQDFDYKLDDSKKMSVNGREYWAKIAKDWEMSGFLKISIVSSSAQDIDKNGISVCIRNCIKKGLENLDLKPIKSTVLLDGGLRAPQEYKSQETIIKGDQKEKMISLASVVAKVARDDYMVKIAKKYPLYGLDKNKGYGTLNHRKSLRNKGISPLHRKTFLTRILDNNQ